MPGSLRDGQPARFEETGLETIDKGGRRYQPTAGFEKGETICQKGAYPDDVFKQVKGGDNVERVGGEYFTDTTDIRPDGLKSESLF